MAQQEPPDSIVLRSGTFSECLKSLDIALIEAFSSTHIPPQFINNRSFNNCAFPVSWNCQGLPWHQGWIFVSSWHMEDPALWFHCRLCVLGSFLAPSVLGSLGNRHEDKDLCETSLLRSDLDIYAYKEIAEVTLGRGRIWSLILSLKGLRQSRWESHLGWPFRVVLPWE